jgi:hypothetical protein
MFKEKPGDDTGMQTRVWGPAGWLFLHSIAQNYPWKPTPEQQEYYFLFFKLVGNVLPCRYCRESYQKFIEQGKSRLTLNTMINRKSIVTWLYNIHNRINKKLGIKDKPTLREVWNKYESFRSKCHKTPEKLNKIKKGCLDPMIGLRKRCFIKVEDVDEEGNKFGKKTDKSDRQKILNAMKVLEITDENNVVEIKKKYRELSLIYHPDKINGDEEKFIEICNAYRVLMKLNGTHFGKSKGKSKQIKLVSIKKSTKKDKKLMATFETNGRTKIIHFGASGMSDFTKHHDLVRRNRYIFRHLKDYRTGDPSRAGYLSMFILWNKISLEASISDYRRRLGVYNRTGKFPINITGYKSPGKK